MNTLEDAVQILRVANAGLATATALAYLLRINRVWEIRSHGQRTVRVGFVALLLTAAYGAAESYAQHAPVGARTLLVTTACAVILTGLWRQRHDTGHHDRT